MTLPAIEEILAQEFAQVEVSRGLRLGDDPDRRLAAQSLVGLAFSGGGIRSATFNLGILQALAKAKTLRAFDYLSTVSGGGYIGSWLMGWMHHQRIGIKKIEEHLSDHSASPGQTAERPEVRFLRSYSNYLTPRKGLFGADFWAFAASYLRNTLLNQLILVLFLLSILLFPRSIVMLFHILEIAENALQQQCELPLRHYMYAQYFSAFLGVMLSALAIFYMGRNLVIPTTAKSEGYPWFSGQRPIQVLIVIPLFFSAGLLTYALAHFLIDYPILAHPWTLLPLLGVVLYGGLWAAALIVRTIFLGERQVAGLESPSGWWLLCTAVLAGAVNSYLFLPYSRLLIVTRASTGDELRAATTWHVLTFGTPAFMLIMLAAGALHIGLMGRKMSDSHREWWARLGGWLIIYAIGWLFLFLVALYAPYAIERIFRYAHHEHSGTITFTGISAWVLSTAYGVFFGKSSKTDDFLPSDPLRKKILNYLARLTPYIFILGLLIALALLASKIAHELGGVHRSILNLPSDAAFYPWQVPALCLLCFLVAAAISWRVDINEFSIHYLYRNRLVRCYLGASVQDRDPQPFTGFCDADDVPLASLQIPRGATDDIDDRPLPLLNTTLNVVRGKELGLQTRKARSFPFTPLYAGFTRPDPGSSGVDSLFELAALLGSDRPDSKNGVRLGTAMAISGAAVSPNMGFYSAPDLSFLMTIFDVRLGWWLANPTGKIEKWRIGSPTIGFYWLLRELAGATSDDSEYLYLSDGGHFENLGIYELVRRRCKVIVACDASEDALYGCGDLHNAMERCRVDFGVEIEITADEIGKITPAGAPPRASAHFAIGVIHYTPGNPEDDGVLIYVKPALRASDSADLLGYSQTNPHFPHDSTVDQWFDESHFENYRALGEAAGRAALGSIQSAVDQVLGTKLRTP